MSHRTNRSSTATLLLTCLLGAAGFSSRSVRAALYTVGPGGTHATVQAAVDAAATPGFDEIRIHAGTYFEAVNFSIVNNAVTVSGGWNDGFTSRSSDPLATRVTLARKPDKGFAVSLQNGALRLVGLTFEGGVLGPGATRPFVAGATGSFFEMSQCVVRGHKVRGQASSAQVLAMQVATYGVPSRIVISDSRFAGNRAVSAGGRAPKHQLLGGALLVAVVGDSPGTTVELARNVFEDNVIEDAQVTSVNGIGLSLMVGSPAATVKVIDSVIRNNRISSPSSKDDSTGLWASVTSQQGTVLIDRTLVLGNTSAQPSSRQMQVRVGDGAADVKVTNAVVARGSDIGFWGEAADQASLILDGLTIANNGQGYRLLQSEQAVVKIVNSVLAANGEPSTAVGAVTKQRVKTLGLSNFLDAVGNDYRLKASSSAVDAGANAYNVHGELDLAGNPRLRGALVDLGAYEVQ